MKLFLPGFLQGTHTMTTTMALDYEPPSMLIGSNDQKGYLMAIVEETAVPIGSGGLIQNLGPDALYLGGSTVTTETGLRLSSGESLSIGLANDTLYCVSAGTSDIRVLGRATGIYPIVMPAP